jgi:hypothetical protein
MSALILDCKYRGFMHLKEYEMSITSLKQYQILLILKSRLNNTQKERKSAKITMLYSKNHPE